MVVDQSGYPSHVRQQLLTKKALSHQLAVLTLPKPFFLMFLCTVGAHVSLGPIARVYCVFLRVTQYVSSATQWEKTQ